MSYRGPTFGMSLMQKARFQWKRGWNEIPEVMGSSIFFVIGVTGSLACLYNWSQLENQTKRFKHRLIVMRPDDPQVKKLKRFENSPPITSV